MTIDVHNTIFSFMRNWIDRPKRVVIPNARQNLSRET